MTTTCSHGSCDCGSCTGKRCRQLQQKLFDFDKAMAKWHRQLDHTGISASYKSLCETELKSLADQRSEVLRRLCAACPDVSECLNDSNRARGPEETFDPHAERPDHVKELDADIDDAYVKAIRRRVRNQGRRQEGAEQTQQVKQLHASFEAQQRVMNQLGGSLTRLGLLLAQRNAR